jgi:hypothetical protein
MKIKYAIVSSNDNPTYLDFWPIVKELWVNLINIKPILVLISDKDIVTDFGDYIIHEFKALDGINTGLQAQIARMYVTKYYADDVCLTSDIDMLPLSIEYFNNYCNSESDNSLVILSSDAYKTLRYPICYNVAKGSTFNEILGLDVSFKDYSDRLLAYGWGWDTDELYFGLKVNEFKDKTRIHLRKRGWVNGIANCRIDRISYTAWDYDIQSLKKDMYLDCHSLRPYSIKKDLIDKLIKDRTCQ